MPRWGGSGPGRLGVAVVVGGAALGTLATVVTHTGPGTMLGAIVIAATATAALLVRPRAAYLIIPVPALAYAVAAVLAGAVHDRATDTTPTALAASAAQWIAHGFLWMTAATLLAIAATAARWPWRERRQRPLEGSPSVWPIPQDIPGQPVRRG